MDMSILIRNVQLNEKPTDIFIDGMLIRQIGQGLQVNADEIIDGYKKAVFPGFVNAHAHAAMTLFRGLAEDLPLERWLKEKIWPAEARHTDETIYWGTKLACLEMIETGTTCFNDMYFRPKMAYQAISEMGLRAMITDTIFDFFEPERAEKAKRMTEENLKLSQVFDSTIRYSVAPHAIYSVSAELFKWSADFAKANGLIMHTHLAESRQEYENSIKDFGLSPVKYLHKLGVLSPNLSLAHMLWIDDEDIQILADYDVKVVHNPQSNLKIASGYEFKYEEMKQKGITVCLGMDGCASSNNLDMTEGMKLASLLQKAWRFDPTKLPEKEALDMATVNGAKTFEINAGLVKEGYLADLILIDLNQTSFTPNHNTIANLVYAANGSTVDTLICNGKILMKNRFVNGRQTIIDNAIEAAKIIKG
jgi:5-methylthioadenosine/S-adenosylhomocysteine deaminase